MIRALVLAQRKGNRGIGVVVGIDTDDLQYTAFQDRRWEGIVGKADLTVCGEGHVT